MVGEMVDIDGAHVGKEWGAFHPLTSVRRLDLYECSLACRLIFVGVKTINRDASAVITESRDHVKTITQLLMAWASLSDHQNGLPRRRSCQR